MTRTALLLALALALLAGGCNRRPDDVPVVVSAIGSAAELSDPSKASLDTPQRLLLDATAQGLVRFDANGQVEPGIAERWIVIDDGLSYIFRLREAEWPDGSAVTARQVVSALRRAAAPNSRNALAPFLRVIDEIVEMTPQVIEVRLKRPRPDLLKLFAQPELALFTRKLGGSGPFRIQQDAGPGVLLRPAFDPARSDDAAAEEPGPERYVRLHGERAARALVRFAMRRSDLVTGGNFADWPLLSHAGIAPANIRVDPAQGLFGLAVVSRTGFLADAENRAALAMTIDREALTQAVRPEWSPVATLLPSQLDSATAPAAPEWLGIALTERRTNARNRVSSWRGAHPEPLRLRIALPGGPGATLVFAHLAASFRAIGIEAIRVGVDADADLRLIDQVAPYDSGRWYIATACSPCGEPAAALVEAAREAPTLADRSRLIAEADAALVAESAFIPLAQPLRWSVVALRLDAWQGNTRAWHPLNHLRNETE